MFMINKKHVLIFFLLLNISCYIAKINARIWSKFIFYLKKMPAIVIEYFETFYYIFSVSFLDLLFCSLCTLVNF